MGHSPNLQVPIVVRSNPIAQCLIPVVVAIFVITIIIVTVTTIIAMFKRVASSLGN